MTKLINALLQEASGAEPERRSCLRNVFDEQDLHPILEHSVRGSDGASGSMDIFLPTRNVCVEVKERGKVDDPYKPGTGSMLNESAYEQVQRYVWAERERVQNLRSYSDEKTESTFLGIVTDGHLVWMWEWHEGLRQGRPIQEWSNRTLSTPKDVHALVERLKRQQEGKLWSPADPSPIFRHFPAEFENYYERVKDLDSTTTQFHLWKRQLEISGNFPPSVYAEATKLFVLHTTMIMIARGVAAALNGTLRREDINTAGFVGWCNEQQWLHSSSGLVDVIDQFDWISRPIDVLRPLYHGLFAKSYRKLWGEYFTPDWLAEAVVNEVLDEEWLTRQMQFAGTSEPVLGSGVLDPACGSGTFLYHAARRIVNACHTDGITSARWQADLAVRLVYGFDVHPVAVEMSRTTLLRALPDVPSFNPQIYQCDSLMTTRTITDEIQFEADTISVKSRKGATVDVPLSFVLGNQFQDHLNAIVESAREKKSLPPLFKQYRDDEFRRIVNMHTQLTDVIESEGNDVWAWYIGNQAASTRLAESKIDRIVANPPWVRINEIQEPTRKEEVRELASRKNIWSGGKNATGFNIAALFADHCPTLYFDETKENRCGWVLPWAAMRGENWKAYRDVSHFRLNQLWDVGNLPFPEHSKSCVRFEGVNRDGVVRKLRLVKNTKGPIEAHISWTSLVKECEWKAFGQSPESVSSDWLDDTGKALVRNGATLFPHCLVRVARYNEISNDTIEITTEPSRHPPWASIGTRTGTIPKSWLLDAVYSQNLVPFTFSMTKVVIPITTGGQIDPKRDSVKYWKDADSIYRANCGLGGNTPANLLDRLNHHNGLVRQLERFQEHEDQLLVVVNNSGNHLRAVRVPVSTVVDNSLFWLLVDSLEEAKFLLGILNAHCLSNAFRSTKSSDRHFATHFWYRIPIPRYNKNNERHRQLVSVVSQAEEISKLVLADLDSNLSSSMRREKVHNQLSKKGIKENIDRIVQKLLPNHSSTPS